VREDPESALKSAAFLSFKTPPRGTYRSWVICVEQLEPIQQRQASGQDEAADPD
jgi:hypothetical protein